MSSVEDRKYGGEAVAAAADPATWEIWAAPEGHREVLYQRFPEFTCLCPRSGFPDFATLILDYVPGPLVVELKSLKLYINGFRNRGISHEGAVNEIAETLVGLLQPRRLRLIGRFTRRGNIETVVTASYDEERGWTAELPALPGT